LKEKKNWKEGGDRKNREKYRAGGQKKKKLSTEVAEWRGEKEFSGPIRKNKKTQVRPPFLDGIEKREGGWSRIWGVAKKERRGGGGGCHPKNEIDRVRESNLKKGKDPGKKGKVQSELEARRSGATKKKGERKGKGLNGISSGNTSVLQRVHNG